MASNGDSPAFPGRGIAERVGQPGIMSEVLFPGMTIRQYAAIQAMKGFLSNATSIKKMVRIEIANESVIAADLLLKALEVPR